ncbi:MAG TPA: hypothetical protein VKB93_25075 [Thermoanaerobaculia bacterium]|nr:hypothetical protein [Thermoanaerobaculia bacterium]
MPKLLFYAGTAFCFFVALISGALVGFDMPQFARGWWGIAVALLAGLAIAALFLRMAALLAARNLFAALMAVLFVAAAMASLAGVLLLQWRGTAGHLAELRLAALMALGFFLSLTLLSLRPYFNIQASSFLSVIVLLPLPLFLAVLAEERLGSVYFGAVALIFFSIAVHCIRHRHLFLEMTNLRELLDPRGDHRPLAFDS